MRELLNANDNSGDAHSIDDMGPVGDVKLPLSRRDIDTVVEFARLTTATPEM